MVHSINCYIVFSAAGGLKILKGTRGMQKSAASACIVVEDDCR